ncbi:flagellar hook-length control protein FliK, partial [Janthinobacterium sp.]|uniref:flagellar hook-length control protein FliK n=1 Tax=Janthinobacterium sp. TaxID=1871054 RepID=UPI00293D991F
AALDALQLNAAKGREPAPELLTIKEAPHETAALAAPVQQAALQVAAAASALPADKLNGRVGSPAWDQQLGQKIVWMASGGEQSATLTLNPPDLGPLQVVLKVSNDQADVTFTSAQPEVRQALEAALPRLRDMMGEAGIQLANSSVSAGMSEQNRGAGGEARGGRGGGGDRGEHGADVAAVRGGAAPLRGGAQGMVDTFA